MSVKRKHVEGAEGDLFTLISHYQTQELRPKISAAFERMDIDQLQTAVACIVSQDYTNPDSYDFLVSLLSKCILAEFVSHQTAENLPAIYRMLLHKDTPDAIQTMEKLIKLLSPHTIIQSKLVTAITSASDFHAVPMDHAKTRYNMLLAVFYKVRASDKWGAFLSHTSEIVQFLMLSRQYTRGWFNFCVHLCSNRFNACALLNLLAAEMQHVHLHERLVSLYSTTLSAENICACSLDHVHSLLTKFGVEEDDPLFVNMFDQIVHHLAMFEPCVPEQIWFMVHIMQSYHMDKLKCQFSKDGLHPKLLDIACRSLTQWSTICSNQEAPNLLKLAAYVIAQTIIQEDETKTEDAVGAAWAFFESRRNSSDREFDLAVTECIHVLVAISRGTDRKVAHVLKLLAAIVPGNCEPSYIMKEKLIESFLTMAINNQQFDYSLLLDTLFTAMQAAHRNIQETNFKKIFSVFLHGEVLPVNLYKLLRNVSKKVDRSFVVGHDLVRLVAHRAQVRSELDEARELLRALREQVQPLFCIGVCPPQA